MACEIQWSNMRRKVKKNGVKKKNITQRRLELRKLKKKKRKRFGFSFNKTGRLQALGRVSKKNFFLVSGQVGFKHISCRLGSGFNFVRIAGLWTLTLK